MSLSNPTPFADGALLLTREGDLATLTLNRPARRNALNRAMWVALPGAIAEVEADPAVKVLAVTGAGAHFASGADIAEFETVYATRASAAAYRDLVAAGIGALAGLSKPAVAVIRGACVGGGVALALACDLRLCAADARLGITPGKLGLMYSLADTKRLSDAVGASAAKDLLFTGRLVDAAEALRMGLVDATHAPEDLAAAATAKARAITDASQWSARRTKAVVAMILAGAAADTPETRDWFLDAMEGKDFAEGRDAFLAKRPPAFPFR